MKKIISIMLLVTIALFNGYSQSQKSIIKNGQYESPLGTFTIGIENGVLTGFYEFYDHWDTQLHTYLQQDVFYIYGTTDDGKRYKILAALDGFEDRIKGDLWIEPNYKIKIVLSDIPGTGCSFDITQESEDSYFPLKKEMPIIGMCFIKSKKASLYNYSGTTFTKRKGYLVRHNWIYIKERKETYTKVGYKSLETGKITDYWINTADIQNPDPTLWGNF